MVLYAKEKEVSRVRLEQNCKLEPATYIVHKTLTSGIKHVFLNYIVESKNELWKKHWKIFNTEVETCA